MHHIYIIYTHQVKGKPNIPDPHVPRSSSTQQCLLSPIPSLSSCPPKSPAPWSPISQLIAPVLPDQAPALVGHCPRFQFPIPTFRHQIPNPESHQPQSHDLRRPFSRRRGRRSIIPITSRQRRSMYVATYFPTRPPCNRIASRSVAVFPDVEYIFASRRTVADYR